MDLQNDPELRDLLREWTAPETPRSLDGRVLRTRQSWWRVLIFGYLRVPVPVACCLAVLMGLGAWRLSRATSTGCSAEIVPVAKPAAVQHSHPHQGCAQNSSC